MKVADIKNALDINKDQHYKFMDGSVYNNAVLTSKNSVVLILSDGTFLFIDSWRPKDKSYISIYVDINGNKGPNILSKDVFRFELNKISSKNSIKPTVDLDCEIKGDGCFQKIVEDSWQIKYNF